MPSGFLLSAENFSITLIDLPLWTEENKDEMNGKIGATRVYIICLLDGTDELTDEQGRTFFFYSDIYNDDPSFTDVVPPLNQTIWELTSTKIYGDVIFYCSCIKNRGTEESPFWDDQVQDPVINEEELKFFLKSLESNREVITSSVKFEYIDDPIKNQMLKTIIRKMGVEPYF